LVGRLPEAPRTGEDAIEGDGFGGSIRDLVRNPWSFLALLALVILVAGCGGGGEEQPEPPPVPSGGSTVPGGSTVGGSTVRSEAQAETLKDTPFRLNLQQPVPPDFRAAYQRKALIVVAFFKRNPDSSRGVEYPQGIGPDAKVDQALSSLRSDYPQVEFFTYDIDKPGNATTSEDLDRGEYGTLAAQLGVGYTPFVVMLAPRGDQYVIENRFQGYVERGVLDQALFDLTNVDVRGDSSDTDVALDQVELTESGGGVEYFTVTNEGNRDVDLQGFSLRVADPETGEVNDRSAGVQINEEIPVAPGESVSVGRTPDVVDANGNEVAGTFASGQPLRLRPGDQVALLDIGGAVVDTISI
jgi:hypothetical protein